MADLRERFKMIFGASFLVLSIAVVSVSAISFFNCEFFDKSDMCGFVNDDLVRAKWLLNKGNTPTRNTGPEGDHTTGSEYYLYAEATDFGSGDKARIISQKFTGTANTCTRINFFYYAYGEDVGELNVFVLDNEPYYFVTPVWQISQNSKKKWISAELLLDVSFDFSIAFETVFRRSLTDNHGDIAIDDISISSDTSCGASSCGDATCLNGGTCVDISDKQGFKYECECAPGWAGDHCQNDFDDCASNPCNNGTCSHGLNSYICDCYLGYYGPQCEMIDMCISEDLNRCQNGGTCTRIGNDFECACAPGFTGRVCDINIDDCSQDPCQNGAKCVDGVNAYTCDCASSEYYGVNCQYLSGECDFDEGTLQSCGYVDEYGHGHLNWRTEKGRTPLPSTGPPKDHTSGEGYYAYAEVDNREQGSRATATLVSPVLPQSAINSCTTVTFWYYMQGQDVGTLNVYARSDGITPEKPIWTITGDQGVQWISQTLSISSSKPFSVVFESVSKYLAFPIQDTYIGLDDITLTPNNCEYDYCSESSCKNGGICSSEKNSYTCECVGTWTGRDCTEDRNECSEAIPVCLHGGICSDLNPGYQCDCPKSYVGYSCEYVKGSCDFDDPKDQLCQYQNEVIDSGLTWKRMNGPTDTSGTGPNADHTYGTDIGYYIYVEASNVKSTSKARIATPEVPYSGSQCIRLDFWYHMKGRDIGELALYLQFGSENPTEPIWNKIGEQGADWQNAQLNITVPLNFKMIFEATVLAQSIVEPENRGDIAIDDIIVSDETCGYDKCFLQPCKNGGTCIVISESEYRCDCTEAYSGDDCSVINACQQNPCQNDGECILNSKGQQECLCLTGFYGDRCELVDLCVPNPCQNGATCTRLQSTFDCECVPGYTGETCKTNIDECASSPCMNGGKCIDLVNSYECDCTGDYYGERCDRIEGGCNFEDNFCGWTSPSEPYVWTRYQGPGPSYPASGPRFDHTFDNSSGYYILTEMYKDNPEPGTKYRLQSPIFPQSSIEEGKFLILRFYYHMYGPGIGSLNVYYNDNQGTTLIETITKNEDRLEWREYSHKVEPTSDFSFIIEHETIKNPLNLADLAVDDIALLVSDGVVIGDSTTTKRTATICDDCNDGDDDDDANEENDDLEGGAIAGIVIGTLAAVILIIGGIYYYNRRKYTMLETGIGYNLESTA